MPLLLGLAPPRFRALFSKIPIERESYQERSKIGKYKIELIKPSTYPIYLFLVCVATLQYFFLWKQMVRVFESNAEVVAVAV